MMRVHDLPMESLTLKQGIAWYGGTQNQDNSIAEPPPVPYLCDLPAEAVPRARWTARTGLLRVDGRDLMVHYFVDPETLRLFAQPHPDFPAATQSDCGVIDARARFPFELARETARWIYRVAKGKTKKHEEWWRGYMAALKPEAPPIPFGLPVDPSDAYRDQGWISFRDWLVKLPRKPAPYAMPPSRWCGQTAISMARRNDGAGYDCSVGTRNVRWSGVVTLPVGLDDDGSPKMFDEVARMAVAQAATDGFDKRLNFDERDSGYLIRRHEDYDTPVY